MIKNVTCKRSFIPSSNNAAPKKHPPPPHHFSRILPCFAGNPLMQQTRMSQQLQLFLITADADDKGRTHSHILVHRSLCPVSLVNQKKKPKSRPPWMSAAPFYAP